MLKNKIVQAIIGVILFFTLTAVVPRILPPSKKVAARVNYAPDGFTKTVQAEIRGLVTHISHSGLFRVEIDNKKNLTYPFSFDPFQLPDNWKEKYPASANFIAVGDSIIKEKNNDTFYVVKTGQKWLYILPTD